MTAQKKEKEREERRRGRRTPDMETPFDLLV
jgi:hypothetical protein